uniref:Core-2/I-branching beta-1,6-N-acetylglucosaminyltransferase family protein n=1 Tax=Triticum urartu TaxID=4572 RepID=A0A8R7UDF8_TRIUA
MFFRPPSDQDRTGRITRCACDVASLVSTTPRQMTSAAECDTITRGERDAESDDHHATAWHHGGPTRWGNVNVVDAERRLLANALLDFNNERFVLVSESCIPLYPLPVVHAYLTSSRHSFVGAFDDPSPHGRGRYRAGLAPDVTLSQWRKGAQWFEMDRRLAVFVIADERYYPRFRTECRAPCYVDEHYLPTVLSIEAPERIANRSITLVDWSRGGAHPATFGAADVTEDFLGMLVGKKGNAERCMYNGQPVEVCFLFARKFAPAALPQLLSLSSKIFGY